jgi:hypothetical protein
MNGPGSVENQGHSLEQKKIVPDLDVGITCLLLPTIVGTCSYLHVHVTSVCVYF